MAFADVKADGELESVERLEEVAGGPQRGMNGVGRDVGAAQNEYAMLNGFEGCEG